MDTEKKPLIVVIDDSPTVCKIFEVTLSREGYAVQTFQDPVTALRQILVTGETAMPRLFFVDLVFPPDSMNGFEIIQRIRNHSIGKHIPIIALSRRQNLLDELKYRLLRVNALMIKPFKTEDIVAAVQRYTTVQPEQ
jgi:twitching motility two-component system response regulator PilG